MSSFWNCSFLKLYFCNDVSIKSSSENSYGFKYDKTNCFCSFGGFFKSAGNSIANIGSGVYHEVSGDVKGLFNFAGSQINKVTDLPKTLINTYGSVGNNLISTVGSVGNNLVTTAGGTITNLGGDVKGIFEGLSLPITIGLAVGGVVILMVMLKK